MISNSVYIVYYSGINPSSVKKISMKYLLTTFALLILFPFANIACSMCKITMNGKTVVGNNEDWTNPNSQIRFEPKGKGKYGYMCVGFDDNFPQGAVNEAGLMFDGFAMPFKASKETIKKRVVNDSVAIDTIMKSFSTVLQVKAYLSTVDLSTLTRSMLVFIDKSGEYLRVESDELFLGNEPLQTFSNFYPSLTLNTSQVNLPYYQNGCRFLSHTRPQANLSYCSSVMKSFRQRTTQYTTVYNLEKSIIRLFHFQNFQDFIDISLSHELKKGKRIVRIPELFLKNKSVHKTL